MLQHILLYIVSIQLCISELCHNGANIVYNTSLVSIGGNNLKIGFYISCITKEITFKLEGPADRWFGFVFNEEMFGEAIVYTTGKLGDKSQMLHSYYLFGMSKPNIMYNTPQYLTEIKKTSISNSDTIYLQYSRLLNVNDNNYKDFNATIDSNEPIITFRYAFGNDLELSYHGPNAKSHDILSINLQTENISSRKDTKLTLHIMHGIIMWTIWSVLVPVTIFIARNKHFWNDDPKQWFNLHQSIGIVILSLSAIAISIAVYAVDQSQTSKHFERTHHIFGYIVNALLLFHIIGAFFRPNKAVTTKRKYWKLVHALNASLLFLLSNINIIVGINLKGEIELIIVQIIWMSIIGFTLLFFEWNRTHNPLYSKSNSMNINNEEKENENENEIELSKYDANHALTHSLTS